MALPAILLREYQTASISDWVPGNFAQTYKQLESLSFSILNRDPKQWSVHFHLADGVCEGKAIPLLWNNAAYFDESCLQAGRLHLFAHFERIEAPRRQNPIARTASTAPSTIISTDISDGAGLSLNCQDRRAFSKPLPTQNRRKRGRVQDLSSDSESEASAETDFLLSPSNRETLPADEGDTIASGRRRSSVRVLQRSSRATAQQHAIDLAAAIVSNAPYGQYSHKHNWDEISKDYRCKVAHARLINGIYGVPAPVTCDRCVQAGSNCRIYHPDFHATPFSPGACAECRLYSRSCTTDGVGQRMPRKSHSPVKTGMKARSRKAPRLSIPEPLVTNPKVKYYCPVEICPRHWEGIGGKQNYTTHMKQRHPDVDYQDPDDARTAPKTGRRISTPLIRRAISESTSSRTAGSFMCPESSCESCPATGYSRGDKLRKHVRSTHPESIHGRILQAFKDRKLIALPSPPFAAEYAADFQTAHANNASPGTFGHRPTAQWTSNVQTRVAHAKLIQGGKYGVIAPESCGNCRKRGTTCMVYHPGLKDTSRSLGTYCGECRNKNDKCEINTQMWTKVLESSTGVASASSDEGQRLHIIPADAEDSDAEEDHDDTEAGAPLEHEHNSVHVHHPLAQFIQSGEVPESDSPELKVEENEDEQEAALRPCPQEGYDDDLEEGILDARNANSFLNQHVIHNAMHVDEETTS